MTDEATPLHGWSLETLKAYIDVKFDASKELTAGTTIATEKAMAAALASVALAVDKAEKQQLTYNQQQNEWRATINDLTGRVADTARRDTEALVKAQTDKSDASMKGIADKLSDAIERLDRNDGRNTVLAVLAAALVALVVGIGTAFISSSVRSQAPYQAPQMPYVAVAPPAK